MFSVLAMNRRAGSISKIMTNICIDCMAPTGHFASSRGDRHCFSGSLSLLLLSDPQHGTALDQRLSQRSQQVWPFVASSRSSV